MANQPTNPPAEILSPFMESFLCWLVAVPCASMGHKAVPLYLRNARNLHHRQITTLRNEKPNSPQFIYIHPCNLTSIFPLWPVMGKRATRMQDCLPKGYVTKCMRCTRRILAIITGDLPHVQYKSAVCTFTFPRCNNKCSSDMPSILAVNFFY